MSDDLLAMTGARMDRVVHALDHDLQRIRTGGASASMLQGIHVDHHGRRTRIMDIATVSIPDARQIVIQPWDPGTVRAIGTAISASRTGLTPTVDGPRIRLFLPAMTEERRRELATIVHERVERAHVEIRTARHEAMASMRAGERDRSDGVDEARRRMAALQAVTDRAVTEADRLGREAEARLLHV